MEETITVHKRTSLFWIYPALWGVLMYNVLRAVTDLSHNSPFWNGNSYLHITALSLSVFVCYAYNYVWQRRLQRAHGIHSFGSAYRHTLIELFISLNILLLAGQKAGVLLMGAGWVDYMLINATYIPLLVIFYTLIRNNIISRHIQHKALAMELLKVQKTEAELNFLKAQYHPHFLFNALNTIYFQIEDTNTEARQTVEQLSALLRYQLYYINGNIAFSRELEYLQLYIAFEKKRKTNRLSVSFQADAALQHQQVPPLLLQPLVENAFKFVSGLYQISVTITLSGNTVTCTVTNSVAANATSVKDKDNGIGLDNLQRRLQLLYPGKHTLHTQREDDIFTATLTFQLNQHGN